MKILQVNKFYYRRGGAETYLLEIEEKLTSLGHEVAVFSMHHPKNLPSKWSKYFISRVSFNEGGIWQRIIGAGRVLYSFEARRKFIALLNDFKPDIIHLHNIYHQISPSILSVAKKLGITVVMHLHDYKLICPNYQMFDGKQICYDCLAPNYWQCFIKKCFGNSYAKSFLVSLESFFHHKILKTYKKNIDLYIAPSKFMKDICVKSGVPGSKIRVLYNFTFPLSQVIYSSENYFIYVGRLSIEKGISILLEAAKNNSELIIKIIGTGPQENSLKQMISKNNLDTQVELLGYKDKETVKELMSRAKGVIIPSIWLENMPFVLLEAMSMGKVVIASNIGGLPELITNGINGFTFIPGDSTDLLHQIEKLETANISTIGESARISVLPLNLTAHCDDLLSIYQSVIQVK